LTGTTEATEYRKRLERRKRFISSKRWKRSPKGLLLKEGHSLRIRIAREQRTYRIYVNGVRGNRTFASEESAKSFVFDFIQNGKASDFAKKHPLP
jgi:hypothetical protein